MRAAKSAIEAKGTAPRAASVQPGPAAVGHREGYDEEHGAREREPHGPGIERARRQWLVGTVALVAPAVGEVVGPAQDGLADEDGAGHQGDLAERSTGHRGRRGECRCGAERLARVRCAEEEQRRGRRHGRKYVPALAQRGPHHSDPGYVKPGCAL